MYSGNAPRFFAVGRFFLRLRDYIRDMKWIAVIFLVVPQALLAQGFAGLGQSAEGFDVPVRGTPLQFPQDHGPHPSYRIEWWYLTATLEDAAGTPYGLQWTLFRSALEPHDQQGWDSSQLWLGHAAVTSTDAHFVTERRARGGIGQAGVTVDTAFDAWIDDWHLRGDTGLRALEMRAASPDFAFDMDLTARGPLVLQGDEGYSVKSAAGQASYYYSQPFYEISGVLKLPDGDVAVRGDAWLDREWSSQPLAADQSGWDWFSLGFDDGARMMGFVLRSDDGEHGVSNFTSATWIDPDGHATAFPDGAFKASPLATAEVAARDMPVAWRVQLPERGVDVTLRALNPQSWMDTSVPYWEGPVSIEGSHRGRGYLEMTGY